MKRKFDVKCTVLAVLLITFVGLGESVASGNISSAELISNAKKYDGKQVGYRGEIIGEVMKRGDFAWVNLHDGENAIGIWVPFVLTKNIIYTGSYKAKGDIFEVFGVFNRACPEHGGDLDIHAEVFNKIESGMIVSEEINPGKKHKALIFLGVLVLIWILILFLRKQS